MPWKCKNPECGRTFYLTARITIERKPAYGSMDITRILVDKPCCPFCESIEFEEVKEDKKDLDESKELPTFGH